MELVCLAGLAEQTVDLTRPRWENSASSEGKQISVTVEKHSAPIIRAVSSQLRAALTNRIFNAVDAIDGRGSVHVRIGQEHDMATLTIRDNGEGMDANEKTDDLGITVPMAPVSFPARRYPASHEFPTGPEVGERLPEFTLPNQNGEAINFHQDRGDSKSIVVFYRSAVW